MLTHNIDYARVWIPGWTMRRCEIFAAVSEAMKALLASEEKKVTAGKDKTSAETEIPFPESDAETIPALSAQQSAQLYNGLR